MPVPSPWSKVSAGSRDGLAVTGFADFDVAPGSIRGVMLSPKNLRRLLGQASLSPPPRLLRPADALRVSSASRSRDSTISPSKGVSLYSFILCSHL